MRKTLLFLAISSLLLNGCATKQQMMEKFANQTDAGLCLDWMNLPSVNIWQTEREMEIKKRGIDCSRYGNIADARRKADDAFDRGIQGQQQIYIQQQQLNQQRQMLNCTTTRTGNTANTTCF